MSKSAYFYIDDVVWPFRDITREKPSSIFDQILLKILKEAHDKYGIKLYLTPFIVPTIFMEMMNFLCQK